MGKSQLDEIMQQFIEQNKDQLPALFKFRYDIRNQFLQLRAKEGSTAAILSAYKTIDDVQQAAFAANTQTVSCHACTAAYCCHQSVLICEAEAALIAQYCKENKIKISRKYLQKQLSHNRENIALADCSACVFLKDNRCSIYSVRPVACRTHHVGTPLELCDIKKYKKQRVEFVNNPAAQIIAVVVLEEGGKMDRVPRLLLKYST